MKSSIVLCITLFLSASIIVNAAVMFYDDFENGTAGNPPVGPTIGTYSQQVGTHEIVDTGGNLALKSIDPADDDSFLINCRPTVESPWATVEYTLTIVRDNPVPVGHNAFFQELVLRPLGDNLDLRWGDDGKTYLMPYINGSSQNEIDLSFNWSYDTEYDVHWSIDSDTDTYSLIINGTILQNNVAFGDDLTGLYSLAYGSNSLTVGSQLMDDVIINGVPEPASLCLLAAGGLALLRKRK